MELAENPNREGSKPRYHTSEWMLGCVLMQEDEDGAFHPLAFNGQCLKGVELNYLT